jgi:putative acetyltransferase
MLSIASETPNQDDVATLLHKSDEFAKALYPPESNHLVGAGTLAAANVRFFVARQDGVAVGCGALVLGTGGQAEIKRMFVDPTVRGQGVGRAILQALEETGARESVQLIQLETGVSNHDALTLYRRSGYRERGPFGSYAPDPLSVFMEKRLPPKA